MSRDKKIPYIISLINFAVLLLSLFVDIGSSKIVTACLLLPIAVITLLTIKKRSSLSINKREVLLISAVIGAIYIMIFEMTGLHFGYYHNPYTVNSKTLFTSFIPSVIIIVSAEIIRYVLLAQKNKLVNVITFLSCILSEVLMFSNLAGITSFNRFMDLVGMTLFPAISANVYYHYASKNYGPIPNIVFRLITTLYIYFVPATTAMSEAMQAFIKLALPMAMLTLISAMYDKKKKYAVHRGQKLSNACIAIAFVVIISVAMLISCQFRFGALVIATESMTGEINKGDMIIYEQYDDQIIREGQIIVFEKDESKIVHRVVKIENINGERRYYTKGDANQSLDAGYINDSHIVGLTDVKIAYVGYPTLWLRELIPN